MRYVSVLLSVCLSSVSTAQAYSPLLIPTATWQDTYAAAQAFTATEFECYRYVLDGDSLLNDTLYQILRMTGLYHLSTDGWGGSSTWFSEALVGLVREDTTSKRVYIRPADNWPETEQLLYDFSGEPGLYPATYRFSDYFGDIQVLTVDTVELSDGPHRRIELSGVGSIFEGLGSLRGFMPRRGNVGGLYIQQLVCHEVDSVTTYDLGAILDCECGSDVLVSTHKSMGVTLGPSPTSGLCTLRDAQPGARFHVLSVDGRVVISGSVPNTGSTTIDMTSLPAALYLLRILGPSLAIQTKIIKE